MRPLQSRIKASLILAPAILLLLAWIGRFAASDEVTKVGIWLFLLWSAAASLVIAYTITLYVAFLSKTAERR